MNLNYTDEVICNPAGIQCRVLDITTIDFSQGYIGRKNKETIILKANGNEKIETVNSVGLVESIYITNPGDAIFYNNEKDIYVPRDSHGQAWQFNNITEYGYEITTEPYYYGENVAIKVKSTKKAYLLPEIIIVPTCIKDAWGEGKHQFLFAGAALKQEPETGKVSGIDKGAFDETWEIITEKKNTL